MHTDNYNPRRARLFLILTILSALGTLIFYFSKNGFILHTLDTHRRYYDVNDLHVGLTQFFAVNEFFIRHITPVVLLAGFTLILGLFFAYYRVRGFTAWALSYGVTLVCIICTLIVCYFGSVLPVNHDMKKIINSAAEVDTFKQAQIDLAKTHKQQAPIFIPTGIFIQSIEFENAYNVAINFYIWQRYTKGVHDDIQRGFTLPEVQELDVQESYRKAFGNDTVIGWYVRAKVRESFNYDRYPFDVQDVWIRLWAKDFDKNVILVPDFKAYKEMNPATLPGIEKHLVITSWNIFATAFGYNYNDYNSNFGIDDYVGQTDFPELYFNIFIQRDFLGPFISDLVPIIMVIIILFIAQMVLAIESPFEDFFSFNILEVLGIFATLMFVVILAQIQLRGAIPYAGILYIEYYYFVCYLAIFAVMTNYYLYHRGSEAQFIRHGNNQWPKLLLLPFVSLLMLIITVMVF